ncbi:hypothetical protein [Rhizobium sp. CF080]|uniref:hypothetical protein n=1 Tax=Rhizobium sp. (strain CF080) TaxID=1144310 RepID=UPI0012DD5F42|nr:hypothetical protein [Rhizobium sp. CF080]
MAVGITSCVALYEYAPEAWQVVVKQKRSADPRGRGSHLALYGFFLFSFGSAFACAYSLSWLWYGQPNAWIGSPAANFSRFCHASGFALMQAGPALKKEGFVVRPTWWVTAIAAALLVLLGFYLGLQFKSIEVSDVREWQSVVAARPVCPPGEPGMIPTSKLIHTDSGPYQDRIALRRCVPDAGDDKRSGSPAFRD